MVDKDKNKFSCYAVLHHVIEDGNDFYYCIVPELDCSVTNGYSWSDAVYMVHDLVCCIVTKPEGGIDEEALKSKKYKPVQSSAVAMAKDNEYFNKNIRKYAEEIDFPQVIRVEVDTTDNRYCNHF